MGPVGYVEHIKGPITWLAPYADNIDVRFKYFISTIIWNKIILPLK